MTKESGPVHVLLLGEDLTGCERFAQGTIEAVSRDPHTASCLLLPDRLEWIHTNRGEIDASVAKVRHDSEVVADLAGIPVPWNGDCVKLPFDSKSLENATQGILELPKREGLEGWEAWRWVFSRLS